MKQPSFSTSAALSFLLSMSLIGCATRQGNHDWKIDSASQFPTQEETTLLVEQNQQLSPIEKASDGVFPSWDTLPTTAGPQPLAELSILAKALQKKLPNVHFTTGPTCSAEVLVKLDGEGWNAFSRNSKKTLGALCGLLEPATMWYSTRGEVSASTTEADLVKKWLPDLVERLNKGGHKKNYELGVALTIQKTKEGKTQANVVMVALVPSIEVKPFSRTPAVENRIHIEGRLLPTARLQNPKSLNFMVNQGNYAYARCDMNDDVQLPNFSVDCPVNLQDDFALVEAVATEPGRMIGPMVLRTFLRPSGKDVASFKPFVFVEEKAIDEGDSKKRRLLFSEWVNQVRKKIMAQPLKLQEEQSAFFDQSAVPFFQKLLSQQKSDVKLDRMMLGMLAGWKVQGAVIADGDIHWSFSFGKNESVSHLVNRALRSPVGRQVLLNPQHSELAVGTYSDPDATLDASVYAAWKTFAQRDKAAERSAVLQSLEKARGKRPTGTIDALNPMMIQAANNIDGGQPLNNVLNATLDKAVNTMQLSMNAQILVVHDLYDLHWPQKMRDAPNLFVSISVATYQPKNAPWGQYLVLVMTHYPAGQYASAASPETTQKVASLPATPFEKDVP